MTVPDIGTCQSPEGSPKLQGKSHDNRDELDACYQKLLDDAAAIEALERLSGRGPALADDAVDILTTPQITRETKLYQLFLNDVLRTCGPRFVLLVFGLGKQRVHRLNEKDRTSLVRWIKDNRGTIDSSGLQSLVKEYQVPSMEMVYDRLVQVAGGSRKRVREEAQPSTLKKSRRENAVKVAESDQQRQWEREVKAAEARIGDIYELTVEDARTITFSDQIRGKIWLTDTYYGTTRPLVTIPVSEEMRDQLITSRLPFKVPENGATSGSC